MCKQQKNKIRNFIRSTLVLTVALFFIFFQSYLILIPQAVASSCLSDKDCPKGSCPNGKQYYQYRCDISSKTCGEINYFIDPCYSSSTTSGCPQSLRCGIECCKESEKCLITCTGLNCPYPKCVPISSTSSTSTGSCNAQELMRKCRGCSGLDTTRCTCIPTTCGNNSTSSSTSTGCPQSLRCGAQCCKEGEKCQPISCYGLNCPTRCVSSSSTSSTSSTSTGGVVIASCTGNNISCEGGGPPTCTRGKIAICGSKLGLRGALSGPGCTDKSFYSFSIGGVSCNSIRGKISNTTLKISDIECEKDDLCLDDRKRFASCLEDKVRCQCTCSFNIKGQKHTPRCNKSDQAKCSHDLKPTCTKSTNEPVCHSGKLFCQNLQEGFVDLLDKVDCK